MAFVRELCDSEGVYYVGYWRDTGGRRHRTADFYTKRDALAEALEQEQADAAEAADGQR